jgi:transposase
MPAEVVDAVIGGETHRDTYALEMLARNGATITSPAVENDDDGFVEAIAWIAEHAPGSRIVVGLEGTRSYGIGLPRAVRAADWSSSRSNVRGAAIDAVTSPTPSMRAWLPTPGADGDREGLRILLVPAAK